MRVSDVVGVLRRTPTFHDVDDRALNVLAFNGEQISFAEGDELIAVGDNTRTALIILSGRVEVDPAGKAAAVPCDAATMIGELSLLAGRDSTATVRATEDGEALKIDRALFERLVSEFPEVAALLRAGMMGRMRTMMNDLAGLEAVLRFEPVSATSRQMPRSRGRGRTAAPSSAPLRRR